MKILILRYKPYNPKLISNFITLGFLIQIALMVGGRRKGRYVDEGVVF